MVEGTQEANIVVYLPFDEVGGHVKEIGPRATHGDRDATVVGHDLALLAAELEMDFLR